jgi:uncharacterized Ntn-hydrolase superfamily protein
VATRGLIGRSVPGPARGVGSPPAAERAEVEQLRQAARHGVLVDLRVDDHARPVEELGRLYAIHDALFGKTPDDRWLPVGEELAAELRDRLAAAGYGGDLPHALERWAGAENLENRVDGAVRIDPVVLDRLRSKS